MPQHWYNFNFYKNVVFFQCSCHSKQTIWKMILLILPKEHTAVTLQVFNHAEHVSFFYKQHFYKQQQAEISKKLSSTLRLWHDHKYTKYKICLSLMKVICIKQQFPENFTKFLKTPFLQYTSGRLFWIKNNKKYANVNFQEILFKISKVIGL